MCNLKYLWLITIISYSGLSHSQTNLQFLSQKEAKEILTAEDDFISRLSIFDMSSRMKTDQDVSKEEFLKFVSDSALNWRDNETLRVTQAFRGITNQLERLNVELPAVIQVILTSGKEEGNAAYTRGNAIILQREKLWSEIELTRLMAHEIFHIYTRNNPSQKDALYRVIGFYSIPEVEFPLGLKDRKITNPDAPLNNYAIKVTIHNSQMWVAPILFSSTPRYMTDKGGEFFNYLVLKLLVLKDDKGIDVYSPNNPRIVGLLEVKGYFEQVGKNTNYIIHPEEILADNFALMVLDTPDIPSPEIINQIRKVLERSNLNKSMQSTAKAALD
ncbi:hypothetical protein [Marinomonas foliarum]|uniref:DUF4157 domain-containing protein n=1 Tax=Marinomonas foliarum TaxID=491950 RepID=A0ABX7IPV8_9GAMM|nr:hypothetical protein [Marinomonas foliarum]QRV24352.1 hypothetical protein JSY38_02085 [Marinomonas foliarum]